MQDTDPVNISPEDMALDQHDMVPGTPASPEMLKLIEAKVAEQQSTTQGSKGDMGINPAMAAAMDGYNQISALKEEMSDIPRNSVKYRTRAKRLAKLENAVARLSKPPKHKGRRS